MEKENIKKMLISMRTPGNEERISFLLKSIDAVSASDLNIRLKQMNISEENIEQYLLNLIGEPEIREESEEFIKVNDWFSYGRTGSTIHMHIVPKDLRGTKSELGDEAFYGRFKELLEDFLSRMQDIFSEDDTIDTLFAVSPVFYNKSISWIFESLGFDKLIEIDPNNRSDNMSIEQKEFFINMFNKGEKTKKYIIQKWQEKDY